MIRKPTVLRVIHCNINGVMAYCFARFGDTGMRSDFEGFWEAPRSITQRSCSMLGSISPYPSWWMQLGLGFRGLSLLGL